MGVAGRTLEMPDDATVGDLWQELNSQALDTRVLCAVNEEYVNFDHALRADDEVAFFPPVTGG